jgi:hypothetical protein
MRDTGFIAEHCGGTLSKDNHHKLIRWARQCSEHVLSLYKGNIDNRLVHALLICGEWENGNVKTGIAMKASLGAHAVARESSDPASIAVARSVGHAVATAHMADHSLGAALYALKAVKLAAKSIDEERKWLNEQLNQLPTDIREMVQRNMLLKGKHFKLFGSVLDSIEISQSFCLIFLIFVIL